VGIVERAEPHADTNPVCTEVKPNVESAILTCERNDAGLVCWGEGDVKLADKISRDKVTQASSVNSGGAADEEDDMLWPLRSATAGRSGKAGN